MLAQVKKLAGGDIAGRFGAWWNGRDYAAPDAPEAGEGGERAIDREIPGDGAAAPGDVAAADAAAEPAAEAVEQAAPVAAEAAAKAPNRNQVINGGAVRIRALETLWGEGRLAPGSFALDTRMIDAALELANGPGDIGFIGVDGALLTSFAGQSGRQALVSEWRAECVSRLAESAPQARVTPGEVDRPRGLPDGALPAVISVEAFAFADHKAGMVGRVHRALDATGRWVFLDTTRTTKKTPPQAFASAWAEPQLATDQEIEELLQLAGFKTVRKVSVNALVLQAAKQGYQQLAHVLEQAATSGLSGREGALFLQELAWEAQSWRARSRAIEGGALDVNIWVADKTEQVGPLAISLDQIVGADDAGAADALFDQG